VGDTKKTKIIENRDQLIRWLSDGCKPKDTWLIGTEHEKFGFRLDGHGPLPYSCDGPSIRKILIGMQRFGWQPMEEEGHLIGLLRDGASVTLEPGGQFELSGAPLPDIHQTCAEVNTHLHEVKQVADEIGAGFLGLGFSPVWALEDTPMMPKPRYQIMRDYMPKVGRLGRQMMFRSCTVQVNLVWSKKCGLVWRYNRWLPLCLPTRHLPTIARTVSCRIGAMSGAIPTRTGPACYRLCLKMGWGSSAMWIMP